MKHYIIPILFLFILKMGFSQDFVRVENGIFMKGEKPYRYLGTNFWYGMNLGEKGNKDGRKRLIRELDRLQNAGVNNLRIMGLTEGPDSEPYRIIPALIKEPEQFDEKLLKGLDFLLSEMAKRDMHAVVVLNNFWPWSGGMAQYLSWVNNESIPYPPPHPGGSFRGYQKFTASFYSNDSATSLFKSHIEKLISRKNSLSGVPYTEDPTIMSWQLGNEPRGDQNLNDFNIWLLETSGFIKALAPKQLVSMGSEGSTSDAKVAGLNFIQNHSVENIDYSTIHIWPENWSWYDPKDPESTFEEAMKKATDYISEHIELSQTLNKPLVIEEFGLGRDGGSYDPEAGVSYRNKFYKLILSHWYISKISGGNLCGINFWAWGGEGRPKSPDGPLWEKGDVFIGDPPHERQGWYSVYDKDKSTIEMLKFYGKE